VKSSTYVLVYPAIAVAMGGDCPDGSLAFALPSGTVALVLDVCRVECFGTTTVLVVVDAPVMLWSPGATLRAMEAMRARKLVQTRHERRFRRDVLRSSCCRRLIPKMSASLIDLQSTYH
jgi:hypothetical protein